MKKLWELKAQRSAKMEALEALAAKMGRAGYVENATDQRDWDYLRSRDRGTRRSDQRGRADPAQSIGRAIPVPGLRGNPPLRRQSGLRAFKDVTDRTAESSAPRRRLTGSVSLSRPRSSTASPRRTSFATPTVYRSRLRSKAPTLRAVRSCPSNGSLRS